MDTMKKDDQPVVQVRVFLAGMLVEELELPGRLSSKPAKKGKGRK